MIDYTSTMGLGSHCMETPEGRARMLANQYIAPEVGVSDIDIRTVMNTNLDILGGIGIEEFVFESERNYYIVADAIKSNNIIPKEVLFSEDAKAVSLELFLL